MLKSTLWLGALATILACPSSGAAEEPPNTVGERVIRIDQSFYDVTLDEPGDRVFALLGPSRASGYLELRGWSCESGNEFLRLDVGAMWNGFAVTENASFFFPRKGQVFCWQPGSDSQNLVDPAEELAGHYIAISRDGRFAVKRGYNTLEIRDTKTQASRTLLKSDDAEAVWKLVARFSRSGKLLACVYPAKNPESTGIVRQRLSVIDVESAKLRFVVDLPEGTMRSVRFSPHDEHVLVAGGSNLKPRSWGRNGEVRRGYLLSVDTAKANTHVSDLPKEITAMDVSEPSGTIVVGDIEGGIAYRTLDGQFRNLPASKHQHYMRGIAISASGSTLASASSDGLLWIQPCPPAAPQQQDQP